MQLKPLTDWLSSLSGLAVVVIGVVTNASVIIAAVTGQITKITKIFGVDESSPLNIILPTALAVLVLWYVWYSFKTFITASRVKLPDAFNLIPKGPQSLVGRTSDDPNKDSIRILLNLVKTNLLVVLDGESGCGKSALVKVGLIPTIQNEGDHGLLTVTLIDWGEDWIRGPLTSALDALYRALKQEQRIHIKWEQAPNLAASTEILLKELSKRFTQVQELGLNILLVADQFDDYQGQNRHEFIDPQGSWMSPDELADANPFWQLIRQALTDNTLRILVITRSDSVASLSCIDFVASNLKRSHTLQRVEGHYLHQLLLDIAPDDANPVIVSNPYNGWHQLRECLERDLKNQGDILMQQVRTILLGLKYLPALTPSEYKRHGKLRGLETLVISKAIARAGESDEKKITLVRSLLQKLVLKGIENQKSKAKRESFSTLVATIGDEKLTKKILSSLQADQIVRTYFLDSNDAAWQLDHDYLVDAVLADYRQANRWSTELFEQSSKFNQSDNSLVQRWSALLSTYSFFRILWEGLCKRLPFDMDRRYLIFSGLKQGVLAGCLVLSGSLVFFGYQDYELTKRADELVNQIVVPEDEKGVLDIWLSEESLRERVLRIMAKKNIGQLGIAVDNGWHRAQGGNTAESNKKVASILLSGMEKSFSKNFYVQDNFYAAYMEILPFVVDPKYLKESASKFRELMLSGDMFSVHLYDATLGQMVDYQFFKLEAGVLRKQLDSSDMDVHIIENFCFSYVNLINRYDNQDELTVGIEFLKKN